MLWIGYFNSYLLLVYRRRLLALFNMRRGSGVKWKAELVSAYRFHINVKGIFCQDLYIFRNYDHDMLILDQRRRRLESIEKEGDQDTVMAKLLDQAAGLNSQRVKYAIEIKVKLEVKCLYVFEVILLVVLIIQGGFDSDSSGYLLAFNNLLSINI